VQQHAENAGIILVVVQGKQRKCVPMANGPPELIVLQLRFVIMVHVTKGPLYVIPGRKYVPLINVVAPAIILYLNHLANPAIDAIVDLDSSVMVELFLVIPLTLTTAGMLRIIDISGI
jgi:hypothetical protein